MQEGVSTKAEPSHGSGMCKVQDKETPAKQSVEGPRGHGGMRDGHCDQAAAAHLVTGAGSGHNPYVTLCPASRLPLLLAVAGNTGGSVSENFRGPTLRMQDT